MVNGAAPGVGGGDAVADQPLVQRQIRELALLGARAGEDLIRWLAGPVATCDSRCGGTRTGPQAIDAVGLGRRGAGGCCRARPGGGAGLRSGLGAGHRVAALGGDAGELPQVLAGEQAPPADLDARQVAEARLVIQQVAGQAAGRAASWTEQASHPPCESRPVRPAVPAAMLPPGGGP